MKRKCDLRFIDALSCNCGSYVRAPGFSGAVPQPFPDLAFMYGACALFSFSVTWFTFSTFCLFVLVSMSELPPRASYAPGARRHNDQELLAAILQTAHASLEHINLRILVRLLKRVIEVLQETQEYRDTQSTCQEGCAHSGEGPMGEGRRHAV